MESMGTAGVGEVINPYREFAERLVVAMRAPDTYRLLTWLTGMPGTPLQPRIPAPPGRWVVCGYGRFGEEVVRAITAGGFDVTVIDPDEPPVPGLRLVQGFGTDAPTLRRAGVADADGIAAGSDDDVANLAMAMAARGINPGIFVILRQNRAHNGGLFRAFGAEMTVVPSEIIANECLALLAARHLSAFLAIIYARDDDWAADVTARLEPVIGAGSPEFWACALDEAEAPGLLDAASRAARAPTVGDLTRDHAARERRLPCLALLLVRDGERVELPSDAAALRPGDELLFAGREQARRKMLQTLRNANTAEYVLTGRESSASLLGRLLAAAAGPQRSQAP
jgi:Trk K+ transport system NAD-binding subunit